VRRVGTLVVAMALVTGCGARPQGGRRLVVATVRQPATSLFFVAQAEGCFRTEGLDLDERTFELGRDALALLRSSTADVAIAFETPLLRAAYADPGLRALTTLHTSIRNTRLVSRRSSGIAAFSGLAGKRIGLARGTNADFFIDLVLQLGGVTPDRVTLLDLAPRASAAALVDGTLDAAVLSDPAALEAEQLLGGAAVVLQSDLYVEASLLVTREDVLRARAPALRALLRGLACAERLAQEHPDRVRERISDRFPEQGAEALRAQLARVTWGLGLDNVLLDGLWRERDALNATGGMGGQPPDLRQLLAPQLLEEVSPEAVMLLTGPRASP
jgi:ABC-type nitrate/sulfonate/bicarbonate transport system substrate-binding protein